MTDFDYEVMQRKRLAGQARYKKNGSKSKKCTLPSDRLTYKQWKERNGAVMSYNINKPMKWAEFKELPQDLQEEYLRNLIDKHYATGTLIAQMLGVTPSTFSRYVSTSKMNVKFTKFVRRTAEQVEVWNDFVNGSDEKVEEKAPAVEVVPAVEERPVAKPCSCTTSSGAEHVCKCAAASEPVAKQTMAMERFELAFSGKLDVEMIANSLRSILGTNSRGRIQVVCGLE